MCAMMEKLRIRFSGELPGSRARLAVRHRQDRDGALSTGEAALDASARGSHCDASTTSLTVGAPPEPGRPELAPAMAGKARRPCLKTPPPGRPPPVTLLQPVSPKLSFEIYQKDHTCSRTHWAFTRMSRLCPNLQDLRRLERSMRRSCAQCLGKELEFSA